MTTELRLQNQSQQLYVRALSSAWRNRIQLHEPGVWLNRDPEIEEKMLRDADIAHAVGFRRHMIAGRQWMLMPTAADDPRSEMAVAIGTDLVNGIKHFTQARLQLARAFFSGARFARIHGETRRLKIGDGKERIWWVPTRLEDQDKRQYRIVPKDNEDRTGLDAYWQAFDLYKGDWVTQSVWDARHTIRHVYQDDQATLGHGRALREALGWWWYAKEHVFHESLQAVERFAQGIITAKVDGARDAESGLPNQALIEQWTEVLENLRSRHVLVHDAGDEISTVQTNSSGWELLNSIRSELRSTIFTLVLGANLTTAANEGGSYALAEVQENSTEALIQFDRETLEETLTDDLLGCIWFRNHANMQELGLCNSRPRFCIKQEKRQNPTERAQVAQTLYGMGVKLAVDDILEQTGFRQPQEGEAILSSAPPPSAPGAVDLSALGLG